MIPSGYKEDVVYSEIPINGAGDMSFTRASNGTRINSQGLVEVVPWNLFQQSENLPNAVWTKSTLTFNSTVTAPNGTSTAQNYSTAGAYSYALQTISVSSGEYYTVSCYLKYTSGVGSISIGYTDAPSNNFIRVDANLINGTIGSVSYGGNGANGTATIISVGDGWYRVTVSGTLTIGTAGLIVSNLALGATTFSIWGAQLNIGSTAKPYFPTTDRLNVPRLTYQNGGGGCPSLLLEKQSTNLLSYSQDFTNVYWNKTNVGIGDVAVVTANYAISPDGTQNATRFVCNLNGGTTASTRSWMLANFTPQATVTISIWIKLNSAGTKTIVFSDSGGQTKTISGTDWQRVDTSVSGAAGEFRIGLVGGSSSDTLDCCIWGAQAEGSSYVTSYIPTTSSSATRVADLDTSDTIQTAQTFAGDFTIFADFVPFIDSTDANGLMILGGGASGLGATYKSYLWFSGSNVYLSGDGEVIIIQRGYSMVVNQRVKIAFTRVGTTVKMFVNGAQVGASATSSTSITIRSIGWSYNLPTYQTKGKINQVVLSATGFSDADCQSLTTI